ncbi:SPASM domain-containing protein [bacterium]|nr:SPASM domain-containing protein [bacterium]
MDAKRIEEYHASRPLPDKPFRSSCYAAHVSMYFDTLGNVLACCQNTKYPVGNVQTERLPDIWNGPKIKKLRNALEKDRFGAGCQFCEWQISVGNYVNAFTRNFDRFPVTSQNPDWPRMMEFSVSNTCNLECIMCIGTLSSSIRARREGLPPLPKAYSEQFFHDLRPFLKHLEFAKFLGGEPFLAAESFRVWDLMHEEKANILCNVTTNGTQWNDRVENVLERFPISICISMDGTTAKTVESIRVNAKFDVVNENFRRFHRYCRERKTDITLTYCLMRQNWHEFGDYLLFGDDWDCEVCVNLVREPPHCSLYTLPVEELSTIADALEKQSSIYLPKLRKNRRVWIEQLTAIRRRVEHSSESSRSPFATPLALVVLDRNPILESPDRMTFEKAKSRLVHAVGTGADTIVFSADQDDRVQSFESPDNTFFGVPSADSAGQPFEEIVRQLVDRRGPQRTIPIYRTAEYVDRAVLFHHPSGRLDALRVIAVPKLNEFGMPSGSVAASAFLRMEPTSLASREEDSCRHMDDWAGTMMRFMLDPEGRLIEMPTDLTGGLGLLEKLRVGMTEAEFDRATVEAWGQKQILHDDVSPEREMYSFCHVRGHDILMARMMTRPSFDHEGKHLGYQRDISYRLIDPPKALEIADQAKATLLEWAGNSALVRVQHNRADEVVRFDGDSDVLAGFPVDSLVGMKGWQVPESLVKHWGGGNIFRWNLNSQRLDLQVDALADDGYHQFRMIAVPNFNAGGHYQGRTCLIASTTLQKSSVEDVRQSMKDATLLLGSSAELIEVTFDRQGKQVHLTGTGDWLGIPSTDWRGISLDDIEGRLAARLGKCHYRQWIEKPGEIAITREHSRPGRWTYVRSSKVPTIDAEGRCLGTTMLLVGTTVDPERSMQIEQEARQRTGELVDSQEWIALVEKPWGEIISIEGDSSPLANPSDLLGQSFDQVVKENPSAPISYLHWRMNPLDLDEALERIGPSGPQQISSIRIPRVASAADEPVMVRWVAQRTLPWYRMSKEMMDVEAMLVSWPCVGPVVSLGLDADGQVIEVYPDPSSLGLSTEQCLGKTIDEVRALAGFGPDQAKRAWQAEPGHAIDQIDEVLSVKPQGAEARRLRRRAVPTYRANFRVASVEKLAIQVEQYK